MKVLNRLRIPKRVLVGSVLAVGVITAGLLTGFGVHTFQEMPVKIIESLEDSQWQALNVRLYGFQNDESFARAEKQLTQTTQLAPYRNNPIPYFLRAELHQAQGHFEQAHKDYTKVLKLSEQNWFAKHQYSLLMDDAHAQIAFLYYKNNKERQSQQNLLAIQNAYPMDDEMLYIALADRLESPERADFHFLLAKELIRRLELEKAQEELSLARSLAHNPQLLLEIENFQQTQMPYQVHNLSPLLRYYSQAAAYHLHEKEDTKLAIRFLRQALQLAPGFEWLHNELAIAYRQNHQYDAAIRHAKVAAAINPNHYHAYLTLGDLAVDQAKYPVAIQNFQKAHTIIKSLPDSENQQLQANVYNQLGYAFECMEQWQAAQNNYRQAMNDADARDDYEAASEYEYAQEALERVATSMKEQKPILSQGKRETLL